VEASATRLAGPLTSQKPLFLPGDSMNGSKPMLYPNPDETWKILITKKQKSLAIKGQHWKHALRLYNSPSGDVAKV